MVSRVFTLTLLVCLFLAVSAQTSFPLCQDILDSFGRSEINLFFNGQTVPNVLQEVCATELSGGVLQLNRVYYCAAGLLDADKERIILDYDEIHDFNDFPGGVICSNFDRQPVPPPTIPPSVMPCPPTNVPTELSQYDSDADLCFTTCSTRVRSIQGGNVGRQRTRTIVLCCPDYELVQPPPNRFSSSRFSFFQFQTYSCKPINTL